MINSCLKRFALCLSLSTNLHASEFFGEDDPQDTPSTSHVNSTAGLDTESIPADEPEDKVEAYKNFKPSYGLVGGEEARKNLEALKNHERHREFIPTVTDLPAVVDLSHLCSPIQNQWLLASCTAFAGCGLVEFLLKKEGKTDVKQSELFLYYNERKIEGTLPKDEGANMATIIKALHEYGSCPENLLPYNFEDRWYFNNMPSEKCYTEAKKLVDLDQFAHTIVKTDLNEMKTLLANDQPFIIGLKFYESARTWETFRTGYVPMPNLDPNSGDSYLASHALMIVGYDDNKKCFKARNSYGTIMGDNGYLWIPYDYLTNPQLLDGGIFTMFKIGPANSIFTESKPVDTKQADPMPVDAQPIASESIDDKSPISQTSYLSKCSIQ